MLNRISIQSQAGAIAAKTTNASLKLVPSRVAMNYQGNGAQRVRLQSTPPKLQIDQSASLSTLDLDSNLDFMDRQYNRCLQKGMDTIARIVSEGVEFLQPGKNGDPIIRQAKAKLEDNRSLSITAIRQPSTSVQKGSLDITTENVPAVKGDWNYTQGKNEYQRGRVDISQRTRPSIDITVVPGVELSFPQAPVTGRNMNVAL